MEFNRNLKEFPTMLHRDIYMTALRMTPPEVSLSEIEKTDPEIARSGREFYAFMIELLADMYNNPRSYGMNPGAYEEFANGFRYNAVKRKKPIEARILNDQSAAELSSYLELLKSTASLCMIEAYNCFLTAENFDYIKSYKFMTGRQRQKAIPIETVIDMFARMGLVFHNNSDGSANVTNNKYPHMFSAMSALAKSVDASIKKPKSSSLKYFFSYNWGYLEFRQIIQNYKPVYDDCVRFLSDDGRTILTALHNITKEYNMQETYSRPFVIEYHYKGKRVMTIWVHDLWPLEPCRAQKQWTRSIVVRIWGSPRIEYQQNVEKYGEDFVKYFRRHLNYCGCCNPDHVVGRNGIRKVLGRNVRICSDPGGIIKNTTTEDLPYIKKYIDLQIEEIQAGIK
jgi:hypothetical protein